MKYRAPEGVTALSCAGETIAPDEAGRFEAADELAHELAAHGCVVCAEAAPGEDAAPVRPARARARAEKAD
ncbi:hypothetical protein K9U39_10995 [Rhodoblastus acidophilus]|uniref:Uncharacterized protein n=1 Tax=Candidatus Rhodoblastus alkanivorans TaxID=2954117 RepID=A0ABS9Z940_9HYPH|nr:hypothetical protein [Candidatus Rhodoblastus alkanivorans]MCI4680181.1 hypothetical protein [Candidatus Rhodoblastus alkanivorans]MCI4684138.1 hypothetical protein [Candidatus Rhodoblastus alkanivorans]MDI4641458.1 hypothetical protein [Rhodoblastus acidophilus]